MPERLTRVKAKPIAGGILAGALMLAGCASGVSGETQGNTDKQQPKSASTTEMNNSDTMYDLQVKGLEVYRKEAQEKHVVKALTGVCMGWANAIGTTVTLNPGLTTYTDGDRSVEMVVFSTTKYDTTPPRVVFMNGPGVLYGGTGEKKKVITDDMENLGVVTVIFEATNGSAEPQRISDFPIQLTNGNWAYVNEATGVPVAETQLIDEPYSVSAVKQACNDMRTGKDALLDSTI